MPEILWFHLFIESLKYFRVNGFQAHGHLKPGAEHPCKLKTTFTREKGMILNGLVERYFSSIGFRPRVAMRFDNAETIKAMVEAGLGMSMLPHWVLDEKERRKRVFRVRQKEAPLFLDIFLIVPRDSPRRQPVSAFLALARRWSWEHVRRVADPLGD